MLHALRSRAQNHAPPPRGLRDLPPRHQILAWCGLTTNSLDGSKCFLNWWASATKPCPPVLCKGLTSIIPLCACSIWKHRNACTFDNQQPFLLDLVHSIQDKALTWAKAGAKGLNNLIPVT